LFVLKVGNRGKALGIPYIDIQSVSGRKGETIETSKLADKVDDNVSNKIWVLLVCIGADSEGRNSTVHGRNGSTLRR
jgi:hypothetical protein